MKKENYLNDLSDIKQMMERSSRFISLSGLSGVFAGIYALLGTWLIFKRFYSTEGPLYTYEYAFANDLPYVLVVAGGVLFMAFATGIFFTTRRAKRHNLKIWDQTTRRMLLNLAIPLFTGGLICLFLLKENHFTWVAPATLIFYGLALVNASQQTYRDIRYLGLSEIVVGIIALNFVGYGLLFWAIGFGVLHIVYGALMYYRYER